MSQTDQPHYIPPFEHLGNLLLACRPNGHDKQLDRQPGPCGSHLPKNTGRNRAALLFHALPDDSLIGEDWIGLSGPSDFHMASASHLKLLKPRTDGTVDLQSILDIPDSLAVKHRFEPAQDHHGLCSEVALINGLFHYLNLHKDYNSGRVRDCSARLYLMTELLPCSSCRKILTEFLTAFPHTELHVAYMFDISEKSVEKDIRDFLRSLGHPAEAYKTQAISHKDTGYLMTDASRQWRPEGYVPPARHDASCNEDGKFSLHIVKVEQAPSGYIIPPATMPARDAGQTSAHFNANIGPG